MARRFSARISKGVSVKTGRMVHCHFPKSALIEEVNRSGAAAVLTNWQGTKEEAITAIQNDPRSCFIVGACDNQGPDGSCLGHEIPRPQRVQRSRVKGWKTPPNTVYVGRPTKWGNPFRVSTAKCSCRSVGECNHHCAATAEEAVRLYRVWAEGWTNDRGLKTKLKELRGKNLSCWCPLDKPCHADVLLELANQ
jgi:hypothetical protein